MLKEQILNIIQSRSVHLGELARLCHTSESHVLQQVFLLQEDKHRIRIEQGYVYIDKGPDMWAFVAGVFALTTLILAVLL